MMKPEDYLEGRQCRFGMMGATEYHDPYSCKVPANRAWWAEHHKVATPLCDKHIEETSEWYKSKNPKERQFSTTLEEVWSAFR